MEWQGYASLVVLFYLIATLVVVQRVHPDRQLQRAEVLVRMSIPVMLVWLAITSTLLF